MCIPFPAFQMQLYLLPFHSAVSIVFNLLLIEKDVRLQLLRPRSTTSSSKPSPTPICD